VTSSPIPNVDLPFSPTPSSTPNSQPSIGTPISQPFSPSVPLPHIHQPHILSHRSESPGSRPTFSPSVTIYITW
jgi:hypothetical protein